MAVFPKIQSPCPYKSRLAQVMDGDMCRMCNRQVFDLTFMADEERVAFLRGCEEEVCVSYKLPIRPAIAAAALAASAMALPTAAAAQDSAPVVADAAVEEAIEDLAYQEVEIFVGGIKDPKEVELVEDPKDSDLAELPVVYEDEAAPAGEAPAVSSPA